MSKVIKANAKVLKALGMSEADRRQFPDGNYVFYYLDFMKFGPLPEYKRIMAETGAVYLTMEEFVAEMKGGSANALPVPLDPAFVMDPVTDESDSAPADSEGDSEEGGQA